MSTIAIHARPVVNQIFSALAPRACRQVLLYNRTLSIDCLPIGCFKQTYAFKLDEIKDPLPHLIHGTEKRFRASIERTGLLKMSRTHVHCIACDPSAIATTEVISGFKKQSNLIVVVDMQQTMKDGMKWYRSKNGVVLTEGPIKPQYLSFRNLDQTT